MYPEKGGSSKELLFVCAHAFRSICNRDFRLHFQEMCKVVMLVIFSKNKETSTLCKVVILVIFNKIKRHLQCVKW